VPTSTQANLKTPPTTLVKLKSSETGPAGLLDHEIKNTNDKNNKEDKNCYSEVKVEIGAL